MPELPEVNTFKEYFDGTSLNQKIIDVSISDGKIIRNIEENVFVEKLVNRTFIGSSRRGKYLFVHLDNSTHVLFHFGMTGDIKYYSEAEERPKYERLHILFEGGSKLGFDCLRKFGRVEHIENLSAYIDNLGLGVDALEITEDDFLEKMGARSGPIKGFLLNQKLVAGVGNLYADEICYQTKVHPGSKVGAIPKKKRKEIFHVMRSILTFAIERAAHYKDYPDDWFWKWRVKGGETEKGEIMMEKIAGRTTFCVKGWQKKYS
jgi:formamidopyrimidine-DNA glycosylase